MTYQSSIFDQWVGASPSPQEIIDGGREQLEQNIQGLCADQSFMRDAGYSYVGPAAQRDIVQCIWDEAIKRLKDIDDPNGLRAGMFDHWKKQRIEENE